MAALDDRNAQSGRTDRAVRYNVRSAALVWMAMMAPAAFAGMVNITGIASWTDSGNKIHPIRGAYIELWDADPLVGKIDLSTTDGEGRYAFTVDNADGAGGARDVFVQVLSAGSRHSVSTDGTIANTYKGKSATLPDIEDINVEFDFAVPGDTVDGQAFSLSDAFYTGVEAATLLRGAPDPVEVLFPKADGTAYFFNLDQIKVLDIDRWDWDVVLHEYAHFLTTGKVGRDKLNNSPGGDHDFGVSMIDYVQTNSKGCHGIALGRCDKDEGLRLAWSEGLATWLALGLEQVAADAGVLPGSVPPVGESVPLVGDTFYDDTQEPKPNPHVDLESSAGSANAGEADESAVMRILWDLADTANEAFDTIKLGFKGVYDLLKTIPGIDRLGTLWDKLFGTSTAKERAGYGAIFEEYNVAPHPTGGAIGKFFSPSQLPTFRWEAGNNGANESFALRIFNNDMSQEILNIDLGEFDRTKLIRGAFERPLEWSELSTLLMGLPDEPAQYTLNFVISGYDRKSDGGVAYVGPQASGSNSYWSGARQFFFSIPEPPGALLIGLGFLIAFGVTRPAPLSPAGPSKWPGRERSDH